MWVMHLTIMMIFTGDTERSRNTFCPPRPLTPKLCMAVVSKPWVYFTLDCEENLHSHRLGLFPKSSPRFKIYPAFNYLACKVSLYLACKVSLTPLNYKRPVAENLNMSTVQMFLSLRYDRTVP